MIPTPPKKSIARQKAAYAILWLAFERLLFVRGVL
jgi:hypothetical protein